jgi:hypothetical protein
MLGVVVFLVFVVVANGIAGMSRSATAEDWVTFTFWAGQYQVSGYERVQWSESDFSGAKVCYDPNDIYNFILKRYWFSCGSFDPTTADEGP